MKRTMIHKIRATISREDGFSFAEMIVVVLLSTFLIGGIYTVLSTGKNSWEINRDRVKLSQELRKGVDWMRKDLRQAGVSTITGVPADGNWYTSITFQTANGVTAGAVTWGTAIQYHLGGTGNQQLLRTVSGADRIVAQYYNTLQFKRTSADPSVVQISAQAQTNTPLHGLISMSMTAQERMRN